MECFVLPESLFLYKIQYQIIIKALGCQTWDYISRNYIYSERSDGPDQYHAWGTGMIPWILSTEKCDGSVNFATARCRGKDCHRELCMLLFRQFCLQFWLTSKLRLELHRGWRNSYWSVKGVSGADIFKYLIVVLSDARTCSVCTCVSAYVCSVCWWLRHDWVWFLFARF